MGNKEIKEKSFSLAKFIVIDLLLNILLQMVLQIFLQQFFEDHIIPIFIGVAVFALVAAISWIIYTSVIKKKLEAKKENKMVQSNRDKIQALQTELLQDYFEIQMTTNYTSWKDEVKNVVIAKMASPYSAYKEMKEKIDTKGISKITVKDFDVTALSALMRFDFTQQCCIDDYIRKCIGRIAIDRNGFSHIANYKDVQSIFNLEETAVDNMSDFLTHLQSIAWAYPQKELFFRKYLGTGNNDGLINIIKQSIAAEINDESAFNSYMIRYLQDLVIIREERAKHYVGLSYNLDGHRYEKKFLDELIESNIENSPVGMRIVAEGGYGKSWTLYELAGRFAEKYLDNSQEGEKTVPILIELGKLYNDCSSIRKKIAQQVFKGEEDRVAELYKNHKLILFLDAIDEAKAEIQADVSREIASLKEAYPNIIFVCASRKSCIDKYPISIPCYAIKELDDDQIVEYMNKVIPETVPDRAELIDKACNDWIGESKKVFLSNNRTPFYVSCYVELIIETGDNDFVDTTQLIEKFLNSVIDREIRKTGFNSDKTTFMNFLKELCRLIDAGGADGEKLLALPENDVIRELTNKIPVDEGQASIKAVGKKLVEIQILSRDEEDMLISFAHQNYKEYINRKYPVKKYRSW